MRGARYLRGWAGLNSPCLHSPAHGLALAAPDPDSSAPRVVALGGEGRQTGLVMETGDSGGSLVGCAQTCCDVVGGDSRQFVKWLAMPEFMHVGSLIVDDIQDVSEERRGGPCAHLRRGA